MKLPKGVLTPAYGKTYNNKREVNHLKDIKEQLENLNSHMLALVTSIGQKK